MTTAGVGANSLDPNDKEYWTKFRLLTRQAFLLDNVKLSESSGQGSSDKIPVNDYGV